MKRILIACEFSGIVRNAFTEVGWDAWSCDLEATEQPGQHYQCDVREVLDKGWDLMIAHPPCTHLCVSGARWFGGKESLQRDSLEFVQLLLSAPIKKIALENPIGIISSKIRKPDQIIQPWQFGDDTIKTTCLWLKGLPKLQSTFIVPKIYRDPDIHNEPRGPRQAKNRSRFFKGIAEAMADQWGNDSILLKSNRPNPWLPVS